MALKDYLVKREARTNICFDCQRACGHCPWSSEFKPVPGWFAVSTHLCVGASRRGKKFVQTYWIKACPLFVRDKPRKSYYYEEALT